MQLLLQTGTNHHDRPNYPNSRTTTTATLAHRLANRHPSADSMATPMIKALIGAIIGALVSFIATALVANERSQRTGTPNS